MKICTVDGCKIPISMSQEFCARCWNNTPTKFQDEYKVAYEKLIRAEGVYDSSVQVIRSIAAKALAPR